MPDVLAALYTRNTWIRINGHGCTAGYWLSGPYPGVNSAGQRVTSDPVQFTNEDSCETTIIRSPSNLCSVIRDMGTVNQADLWGKTRAGAPGSSAPSYPSHNIAPQQVENYEDTISDIKRSASVACNLF